VNCSFYVDDLLKSVPSIDKAITLAKHLTAVLSEGGLWLTKFISSSKQVLASIPVDERGMGCKDLDIQHLPVDRALGLKWDVKSDTLGIKVIIMEQASSRRGCLTAVISLYDPLGFVGPVMLTAKRILQMCCKLSLGWDDKLPEELLGFWEKWTSDLAALNEVQIPRSYFSMTNVVILELHYFCDASELGSGSVSYLRKVMEDGTIERTFFLGKKPHCSKIVRLSPKVRTSSRSYSCLNGQAVTEKT
jgi:hypothetical protein